MPLTRIVNRPVSIYLLRDPRSGCVRYVGATQRTLSERLTGFASQRSNRRLIEWIAELRHGQLRPVIELIAVVEPGGGWSAAEQRHIREYRQSCDLLNLATGGPAATGYVPSPEHLRKNREAQTGRQHSAETRQKISEAHRGKPSPFKGQKRFSDESKARMAAAHRGKVPTAETRAKLSARMKRRLLPADYGERIRAGIAAARRDHGEEWYASALARIKKAQTVAHSLPHPMLGKRHTPEAIEKMRLAKLGKKMPPRQTHGRFIAQRSEGGEGSCRPQ